MEPSRSQNGWAAAWLPRFLRNRPWILAVLVLGTLAMFLSKPYNIDDPLFIWAGRHIQSHPADPYGFEVNWNSTILPMWKVTKNPPLACYYLALSAAGLGWSEPALHLAGLLPALAAILGCYRLACRLCARPFLAAGATLFTPAFLVSSASVMCDTLLLAFWVWAVTLWVEGTEDGNVRRLAGASALMALAALTKYAGICLVPLLLAHGWIQRRRAGSWMGWLLVPALTMAAYQALTGAWYGKELISDAASYATRIRAQFGFPLVVQGLIGLAFAGGGVAVVGLASLFLWRTRAVLTGIGVTAAVVLVSRAAILQKYYYFEGSSTLLLAQVAFWAAAGVSLLALAIAEAVHSPTNARSWLLALWVWGTFLFAAAFNWTINGRSVLLMAPALGIVLARRLEPRGPLFGRNWRLGLGAVLAAGAGLALLVAASDFAYARAVRRLVRDLHAAYGEGRHTLRFYGHWGFQYYMQESGAVPVNTEQPDMNPGDPVAIPAHNPTPFRGGLGAGLERTELQVRGPCWLATMNDAVGAGYYGSVWGPLPFAFGRVPPESVTVAIYRPVPAGPSGR